MKQRPRIPPPTMTPPAPETEAGDNEQASSFKVTADSIELTRPHIKLRESVWSTEKRDQIYELRPQRAVIIHGALIIEEMRLVLPFAGVTIRS